MQEFNLQIQSYEDRLNIIHMAANDMVQERDEEAQVVIRILAQLDKKWNSLHAKIQKCASINKRVEIKTSEDVEKGNFNERVCDSLS